jgi:hypothetical protein
MPGVFMLYLWLFSVLNIVEISERVDTENVKKDGVRKLTF